MTWALLTTGTASKSKLSRVFPAATVLRRGGVRAGAGYARQSHVRRVQPGNVRPANFPCRLERQAKPTPALWPAAAARRGATRCGPRRRDRLFSRRTNQLDGAQLIIKMERRHLDGDVMVASLARSSTNGPAKFDPSTYRDRYQEALQALIEAKMKGVRIEPKEISTPAPVIDLMAALKRSLTQEAPAPKHTPPSARRRGRTAPDRRQPGLLLPVSGARNQKKEPVAQPGSARRRRRA